MLELCNQILSISVEIGIGIAIILFIRYCYNHRTNVSFLNLAGIVIASQAIIGGLGLCYKAVILAKWDLGQSEKVYVFIGGLAVTWNAIVSINRLISKPKSTA